MFWKMTMTRLDAGRALPEQWDGRYVMHRHHDLGGPHLDLRIEQDGYLLGWRLDGTHMDGEVYGTSKAPHPLSWLDQDGDAIREDAGLYAWVSREERRSVALLQGRDGAIRQLEAVLEEGLSPKDMAAIRSSLSEHGAMASDAARLIADGVYARRRTLERLCGLGRELDGPAFDEGHWRSVLAGWPLADLHAQLRAYEVRFDHKYPPSPVSRPERLEEPGEGGSARAYEIVRENS